MLSLFTYFDKGNNKCGNESCIFQVVSLDRFIVFYTVKPQWLECLWVQDMGLLSYWVDHGARSGGKGQ